MDREWAGNGALPGIVSFAMHFAAGVFFTQGNLIEPVVIYRKDGLICEPAVVPIPLEVLGSCDIRERVGESMRQFVFDRNPDELVLVLEGFLTGGVGQTRCLSLVYSTVSGERTWVAPVVDKGVDSWREILVRSGEFYQLYEKANYRWN